MIIEHFLDEDCLTENEKSIANYLMNEEHNLKDLTSSQLGKKSFTSQSAVTRLYKKLGFKNYREFLATFILERHDYLKYENIVDEYPAQYCTTLKDTQKLISSLYEQRMTRTNFLFDENTINRICNRISSASFIDIYGVDMSDTIAKQMAFKLQSLGYHCSFHSSFNEEYIQNINYRENISMIISLSKNSYVEEYVSFLKKKHIYTIGIIDKRNQELIELCDDCLIYDMSDFRDISCLCSVFSANYVADIIFATLSYRKHVKEFLSLYEKRNA